MIKIQPIEELINLALYSSYVSDENPVSLLLIARFESGKTNLLVEFVNNPKMIYLTDATAFGIWKKYANDIDKGKITHILLPDLLTPLQKKYETRNSFIAFLNGLVEEGVAEIQTAFLSIKLKSPKPIGIIACITPEALEDKRHPWASMGFMSRLLPVSFKYSDDSRDEVFKSIFKREYHNNTKFTCNFPSQPEKVKLPEWIAKRAKEMTDKIKVEEEYGFRRQKQLQRLLMASALINGRSVVSPEDLHHMEELARFMNVSATEEL